MRGAIVAVVVLLGAVVSSARTQDHHERSPAAAAKSPSAGKNIEGTWQGIIHVPGGNLRTVLKISRNSAGALSATMYSIDQGGRPLVTNAVTYQDGVLHFSDQFAGLTFDGKISADGNSVSGRVQQGASFPLVLDRATPQTEWTIPEAPPKITAMAPDAKPGVEVATIKPSSPDAHRTVITFRGSDIVIRRMSLNDLVEYAFDVHQKQIVDCPDWMNAEKFDIEARPDQPGTPSSEQFRLIIQKLLANRFALKFSTAQKNMSAYVLTLGRTGAKLTKSADSSDRPGYSEGPGGLLRMRNATMGDFAGILQTTILDRPVVDRTGLRGRWDFVLKWKPDETQFGGQLALSSTNDGSDALPPLFAAIQEQLGLKLTSEKTEVPVLVVKHVEHPSPN